MKYTLLSFICLLFLCCTSNARQKVYTSQTENSKKVLVAYFSCTGHTQNVAEAIAESTGGQIYRITPAEEYTTDDLDWRDKSSRSSREMADEKSRPALNASTLNSQEYNVIFLGYPIWWNQCPRIINSFLEHFNFNGKTVFPFATSGSSSINNSIRLLKAHYPNIIWKNGQLLNNGREEASNWSKKVIESLK